MTEQEQADRIIRAVEEMNTVILARLAAVDARLAVVEQASAARLLERMDLFEAGQNTRLATVVQQSGDLKQAIEEARLASMAARQECATSRAEVQRMVDGLLSRAFQATGQPPAVQPHPATPSPEAVKEQAARDALLDGTARLPKRTPTLVEGRYQSALPDPDALATWTDPAAFINVLAESHGVEASSIRAALDGAAKHAPAPALQPFRDYVYQAVKGQPGMTPESALERSKTLRTYVGALRILAGPTLIERDGVQYHVPWYVRIMADGAEACAVLVAERQARS